MDSVTEFLQTATSILALVAAAGAVLVVVARLLAGRSSLAAELGGRVVAARAPLTLAVAGVATLGSLYFSEIADYTPCRLCWFQRIAMYPIALIALIALIRRDTQARWYTVPLAAIGASISTYHLMIEEGVLDDNGSCSAFGPPCNVTWFEGLGFVSLALMALCGFVAIIVLNTVSFPAATSAVSPDPRKDLS